MLSSSGEQEMSRRKISSSVHDAFESLDGKKWTLNLSFDPNSNNTTANKVCCFGQHQTAISQNSVSLMCVYSFLCALFPNVFIFLSGSLQNKH